MSGFRDKKLRLNPTERSRQKYAHRSASNMLHRSVSGINFVFVYSHSFLRPFWNQALIAWVASRRVRWFACCLRLLYFVALNRRGLLQLARQGELWSEDLAIQMNKTSTSLARDPRRPWKSHDFCCVLLIVTI